MEGDRILMAAGCVAAVAVGAFVFWGPSGIYIYLYQWNVKIKSDIM